MKNLQLKQQTWIATLAMALCFLWTDLVQAQSNAWTGGGTGFMNATYGNDKVGVGRVPKYKFDVKGYIRGRHFVIESSGLGLHSEAHGISILGQSTKYWKFKSDGGIDLYNRNGQRKGVLYHNNANGFGLLDGDHNWALRIERDQYTSFLINNSEKMRINSSGQVIIGATTAPVLSTTGNLSTYKLYVNGGMLAKEVKIDTGWADYVFEEDYNLTSLENVKEHINTYGHLHNTPSEEELAAQGGVELGSITVNQQEKIEELFLHLIEINEKMKSLEKENQTLNNKIEELTK